MKNQTSSKSPSLERSSPRIHGAPSAYTEASQCPTWHDEADSSEEARAKTKDAFEKGTFDRIVFFEEVEKGKRGIANTVQRNKEEKLEEVEGWWDGEEEVETF